MKQKLARWLGAVAAACGLACAHGVAFGQSDPAAAYPSRQIRINVPYSAGGSTDALARLVAAELSSAWKQTVIVENKTGASGMIGNDLVAKAPPDGYTVLLGITFLCVQGYEYHHAYTELNLKLSSGVYGSTFFMLTGFHGFHVFVGMLMLLFITLRLQKGHFSADKHFGFEGAAWYWHFVDVVWLGLYILVYWM